MLFYAHTLNTSHLTEKIFHEELAKFYLEQLSACFWENKYLQEKDIGNLEDLVLNSTFPLEYKIVIFYMLQLNCFKENLLWSHDAKIYNVLVEETLKKSKIKNLNFLKQNEKDKERLVILTNQFLGINHSITYLLLKMIKKVNDEFPEIKEIWIFNINEPPQLNRKELFQSNMIYRYFLHNYQSLMKMYQEMEIDRLNIHYESNDDKIITLKKLDEFAHKIYELKPRYVFSFDEAMILAALCNQFTDVVTLQTGDRLPYSQTTYLAQRGVYEKCKKYALNDKQWVIQHPINTNFLRKNQADLPDFDRKKAGLPEKRILVGIVGNRLKADLKNGEVLKVCKKLIERYNTLDIVFIGRLERKIVEKEVSSDIYNRFYYQGFVENLVQHISVLDICFNPLRQGGGWGVVAALEAKVPVVSLDYGDGATFLTPEGKCKDYEEAFDKICHLLEDKSAYEKIIAIQDETDKKFKNTGVHDVLRYLIDEEEKSENER